MTILVAFVDTIINMRKQFPRVYAFIYHGFKKFSMKKIKISIGRYSEVNEADILLDSSLISRKHIELTWSSGRLFLKCFGKNGIFINDNFRKPGSILYRLPKRCVQI